MTTRKVLAVTIAAIVLAGAVVGLLVVLPIWQARADEETRQRAREAAALSDRLLTEVGDQDEPISKELYERAKGAARAAGYLTGTEDVALRINGYPITTANVQELRAWWPTRLANMQVSHPLDDPYNWRLPLDELNEPERPTLWKFGNVMPLSRRAEKPSYEAEVTYLEQYGVDVAVLAELIETYADFAIALWAGFGLNDEEAEQFVTNLRFQIEHYPDRYPGEREFIRWVGEKHYWKVIAPDRVLRHEVVDEWREQHRWAGRLFYALHEIDDSALAYILDNTSVEFTEHYDLQASVKQAMEYLWLKRERI